MIRFLSSWGKGSGSAQQQGTDSMDDSSDPPVLDNVPDLVLLNLFDYLDRSSLNKLRQVSATARDVIENVYGIHVIVPPRDWTPPTPPATAAGAPAPSRPPIDVSVIKYIVEQMEGKVISTLEMHDMPAPYATLDLEKAIQLPGKVKHVKLNYCGARLLYDVLTKCTNLASFQYETNILRGIASSNLFPIPFMTDAIPTPATGNNLLREINGFPNSTIKLGQLRHINLSINRMTRTNHSDWGNVVFLFLMLPVLPSLTSFEFGFHPSMLISWRTHMGIISCLAEFLTKTPNLQVFRYNSNFDANAGLGMFTDWRTLLFGLIEKYGSNLLKTFGHAANNTQQAIFQNVLQHARNIWNTAGTSLRHLQELDVKLGNFTEHGLFMNLVSHLPSVLTKIKITDLSDEDVDPAEEVSNIYSYFAVPLERDRRLAVYDSLRSVKVNLRYTLIQPTSLTNILRQLPQLKELEFMQTSTRITRLGVMANEVRLEDYANPAVFQNLEKLSLINVCLWCQPTTQQPILAKFKGLRELNITIHENVLKRWIVMPGIQTRDMLPILANLPKLDMVRAKPLLGPPAVNALFSGQGDNADPLVVRDERNKRTLEKLGTLVELQLGEVAQNVRRPSAYEFIFKPVI